MNRQRKREWISVLWLVLTIGAWPPAGGAQVSKLSISSSGISADHIDPRFVEELDKSSYIESLYNRKK